MIRERQREGLNGGRAAGAGGTAVDGGALPLLKVLAGRDPHRDVRSRATTALWALSPQ